MPPDDLLRREPSIDFAILADAVQAVAGKLYVLGAGWDTIHSARFPARHPTLGIAVRINVPWSRANEELTLTIDLVDEDGSSMFAGRQLRHTLLAKPPPLLPAGSEMGIVRSFTFNNLSFPKPGGYAFVLFVDGDELHRLRFSVRERPEVT